MFCFTDASIFHILAYVAIFLLSLIGNSMTVHIIVRGRLIRKNAHLFLLNMAAADLVITVVYLPRMVIMMVYGTKWFVSGTPGLVLCRTVPFLHHVALLLSVLCTLSTTLDRFCSMVFPLRKMITQTVARIIVMSTWVLAIVLRSPYLIAPELIRRSTSSLSCATNLKSLFGRYTEVYTKGLVCLYCTVVVTTLVLYIVTIIKLRGTKPPGAFNTASEKRKEEASRQLLNMLFVITVCFVLCWSVYFFAFDIFNRPLDCSIRFVRLFLAHSNSAINPFVLVWFNKHFRDGYRRFFANVFS